MNSPNKSKSPVVRRITTGGAAMLAAVSIAAESASAQPTQSESAAPPVTMAGGIQSPHPEAVSPTGGTAANKAEPLALTAAQEQLNTKAQHDLNLLAQRALHTTAKHHKRVSREQDIDGSTLARSVITVAAAGKRKDLHGQCGQYTLDVLTPVADDGVSPQLDNVVAITLTENSWDQKNKMTSYNQITIGRNVGTGTVEVSGIYGEETMVADIKSVAANIQPLTASELAAANYQAGLMLDSANRGELTGQMMPAFDSRGYTSQDVAN